MLIPIQNLVDAHHMTVTGVLHLGAHWGEEAEAYRNIGVNHVVWVEANPEVLPRLRNEVGNYGHEIVNACVSDTDGDEVTFHVTIDPERTAMSSSLLELDLHKKHAPWVKEHHQITVTTHRVDTLAAAHPDWSTINFLNADLQGAELLAFKGAEEFLKHVDWIYTEVNTNYLYTDCVLLPELDAWLAERGFQRLDTLMTNCEWGDALYGRRG